MRDNAAVGVAVRLRGLVAVCRCRFFDYVPCRTMSRRATIRFNQCEREGSRDIVHVVTGCRRTREATESSLNAGSVVNAVACAIAIQRTMAERKAQIEEPLRNAVPDLSQRGRCHPRRVPSLRRWGCAGVPEAEQIKRQFIIVYVIFAYFTSLSGKSTGRNARPAAACLLYS